MRAAKCVLQRNNKHKRRWYSSEAVQELQQVLARIELSESPLDPAAYSTLLQRCGHAKALAEGRRVYSHYTATSGGGDEANAIRVKNRFVDMLGNCGCIEEARREFERLERKDAYSWNIMMGAYAQSGYNIQALRLLWEMDLEGEKPSYITFIAILRACSCEELLSYGMRIQSRAIAEGLTSHVRLVTAIQSMYGRCGRVEEARHLFETSVVRDLIAWNSMISAYAQHGYLVEVVGLFRRMGLEGAQATKPTLVSVLDACTRQRSLSVGRSVHACVVEIGLEQDVMVATSLVNMYGKCGSFEDSLSVFGRLKWRDLVAWNAAIQACCEHDRYGDAFELFGRMDVEGYTPNESTYMSVIAACSTPAAIAEGETIHRILLSAEANAGCYCCYTDFVKGALVNMYTKCGRLASARSVFEQQSFQDLISWTSMIVAYAQQGEEDEAMILFHRLDLEGLKPDRVTYLGALDGCSKLAEGKQLHARVLECGNLTDMQVTALICMYAKCGSFEDARSVFGEMSVKNTSAWTAMTAACCQQGDHKEGVVLFRKMDLEGLRASDITFISVLEACANAPDLKQGRALHHRVVSSGSVSEQISNSIVNMYGRCGSLEEARAAFHGMPFKSVVSWSTLIGAYTHHGDVDEATELFLLLQLDGIQPDDVIFVSILSACSHAGLVAESRECFLSMAGNYGVRFAKEHYGCILDVLGRSGRLEDAEDLISSMPFEPSGLQWMSLMCACKTHNDMGRALRVAEHVNDLTPDKATQSCMMLSNMFAACGRWGDAETMRAMALAAQGGHRNVNFQELLKLLSDCPEPSNESQVLRDGEQI